VSVVVIDPAECCTTQAVTPVLQIARMIARQMLSQADLKDDQADNGAVTLVQPISRFGLRRQPQHPPALPGAGRRVPTEQANLS
jgi:hypothetical protein